MPSGLAIAIWLCFCPSSNRAEDFGTWNLELGTVQWVTVFETKKPYSTIRPVSVLQLTRYVKRKRKRLCRLYLCFGPLPPHNTNMGENTFDERDGLE
jgi:hypothetical protein